MKQSTKPLRGAGIAARGTILAVVVAGTLTLGACSGPTGAPSHSAVPAAAEPASASSSVNQTLGGSPQSSSPASSPASSRKTAQVTAAPAQLPAFQAESWVAQAPGSVLTVTGHDIQLNECASVDGATTWQQQPYESSGGNSAILETYTFASAATASSAYTGVLAGMNQCQSISRALQTGSHITANAVCVETAHAADAEAFERTWTGVQGISAAGPQINHLYIAIRDTTILVLHFDQLNTSGSSAATYSVRNDPAVLTMLTNLLAAHA
jgi:hypothetical protein